MEGRYKRCTCNDPISKDAGWAPLYIKNLAIVYVMVGENELALDSN
jgi:hypothetical protein